MNYKIIVDSCGELTAEMKKDEHFQSAPLILTIDDYEVIDNDTFDQAEFIKRAHLSPNVPKSSCPSPEYYMAAYRCEAQNVYAVTLSAQLSGSYNSAKLGENLYREEYGDKNIYVFDSKTASIGETLIAMKIVECEEQGMEFPQVVETVEAYIAQMNTFFVLQTLETLRKNGRLSNLKAVVASALNIKPVMGATDEGTICQLDQGRGMAKALDKMIQIVLEKTTKCEDKILAISHCNCKERAEEVKAKILQKQKFKDIFILNMAGVSTMYANDGGIIISV